MNETKNCQNCKSHFDVTSEDAGFYSKMNVPAPLTCPTCRFQRRLMFRNERTLYKRNCDKCGTPSVTIFSPEGKQPVYCSPCWWGDGWDATTYGMDYDPSRPFLEQLKELRDRVPCMHLIVGASSLVRSDYVNHVGACKDCYLIFNATFCENVLYGSELSRIKESMDILMAANSEMLYETVDSNGTKVFFSDNCGACVETYFSKDCNGCLNVIGCFGLRNKSYHIFNQQVDKATFDQFLNDIRLDTREGVRAMREKADEFFAQFPRRAYYGMQNLNSTGDYMYECKNAKGCYQTIGLEDGAYCQFLTEKPTRDSYDLTEWGMNSERIIDAITVGENCSNVKYCAGAWANCNNIEYSMYAVGSNDCFGCVNLRKGQYCILNKQYSKEEYEILKAQIIQDMKTNPYVDAHGRVFSYGEFLPYDLSYFGYNESHAAQYYPYEKEDILSRGFHYRTPKENVHSATIAWTDVPESISEITDDITKEILECVSCEKAYRIVTAELELLRRFRFPVPDKCPDCRHMARMSRINPPALYERNCGKCGKGITTAYAPERPEVVYCVECYQQEVV